ncbi:hypothetical protein [Mesorhizobium sp.]|jgi:hypothetical protein|nr:hypothetical protein [Mesorhizobium sp.]
MGKPDQPAQMAKMGKNVAIRLVDENEQVAPIADLASDAGR